MKTRLPLVLAIAAVVAVCLFTAVCFAQKRAKIGIVPVCASTFKDTLDNVIWGDTVLSLSDARRIKVKGIEEQKLPSIDVKYPKVVFVVEKKKYDSGATQEILKAIQFIDIAGHIKKELKEKPNDIDFGNINVSKNKKYICINVSTEDVFMTKTRNRETGSMDNISATLFISKIYNTDGVLVNTVKQRNSYTYVSPTGEYVVGSGAYEDDGNITVYSNEGLIAEIERESTPWCIDFSNDGSWFALMVELFNDEIFTHAKTKVERSKSRPVNLLLMDSNGNVFLRKNDLFYDISFSLMIDDKNSIIIMTGGDDYNTYIYSKEGVLREQIKTDRHQYRLFNKRIELKNRYGGVEE